MEKYIEWDLKNNPDFFRKPHSGKYVDTGVLLHVVANVNKPESVSEADFNTVLNAVADELSLIPAMNVTPHLVSPVGLNPGNSVWLEMFDYSKGRYFVSPVTVAWIDNGGVCFADKEWSCYCFIEDYNEGRQKAVHGWRCWDICPVAERMEEVPWNS